LASHGPPGWSWLAQKGKSERKEKEKIKLNKLPDQKLENQNDQPSLYTPPPPQVRKKYIYHYWDMD
jgi:hypothetical protein